MHKTPLPDPADLSAVEVFARTLWGEARGEDRIGREMVANVILYRAKHPGWWGKDVKGVCLKRYQFSCWLPTDPNRIKLLTVTKDDAVFRECLEIAATALDGHLDDLTNGASHYANVVLLTRLNQLPNWVTPDNWRASHGHHEFFLVP